MRLSVDRFLPISASVFALTLLTACGGAAHAEFASPPTTAGPGADYPMTLGEPLTIDGVIYTPADKMNVDEVGYAYADSDGGTAISAAHRTLPLPSYAEVTSLETGKTILVRVERRGPMSGDGLVALSPGATAQLGLKPAGKTPVRVRRVNPPEIERAALRRGERAPERMETPKPLVAVLLRKLGPGLAAASALEPGRTAATGAKPLPRVAKSNVAVAAMASAQPAASVAASSAGPVSARGALVVQVAAFSNKANAEASAAKVGGTISQAGRFWRVRLGPYVAQGEAATALAKARGAGYSDARILRAD
jgi:rare lipoprotein A